MFVLDFLNDADTIRDAFADFHRATILACETDPDKQHDLQLDLPEFPDLEAAVPAASALSFHRVARIG